MVLQKSQDRPDEPTLAQGQPGSDGQAPFLVVQGRRVDRVLELLPDREVGQAAKAFDKGDLGDRGHRRLKAFREARLLPFNQRHHQGGLVREVLVERADTHARDLCDAVGVEAGQRLPGQNASRRRQDHLDGGEGSRLPRGLARLQLGFIHGGKCESFTRVITHILVMPSGAKTGRTENPAPPPPAVMTQRIGANP